MVVLVFRKVFGMSRKEQAMVFVIASASALLPINPFPEGLSKTAKWMAEKYGATPTTEEIEECVAYIEAQTKNRDRKYIGFVANGVAYITENRKRS
jgi:hypothetical protein